MSLAMWPDVQSLIDANRDAARRARDEGDPRRAAAHDSAADQLEMGLS